MTQGRHIVAAGACTPIGRDAQSACAAVRAGISGLSVHPYMVDTTSKPMRAAFAPWLDIGLPGADRMEHLLFAALDEAIEPIFDCPHGGLNLALALGLPSPRPGVPSDLARHLASRVRQRYGSVFRAAASFQSGHAGGLIALRASLEQLDLGAYDACVVAGVDSYIEPESLEWLEENEQLHGAGPLNNAWGFVPGEAAGTLLVMNEGAMHTYGLEPLAEVLAVGVAMEHMRIKTETVCTGVGLTEAFRRALSFLPDEARVSDIYCDMNGEPYRADEFGFATVRTGSWFEDSSAFVAPADCWGDVGAASGTLLACLAVVAAAKTVARGRQPMVWCSSDGGERAAAVLKA